MSAQQPNRSKPKGVAASAGQQAPGTSAARPAKTFNDAPPDTATGLSPERIGKIAHDFNNILTLVLGYGENLLKILPEDHRGRSFAEEICRAAKDGERLSVELASSAHPPRAESTKPAER